MFEQDSPYRLVPFMLLAVLLHGAILFLFNPKISDISYNVKPLIVTLMPQDIPLPMTHVEPKQKLPSPHDAQLPLPTTEAVTPLPNIANEVTMPNVSTSPAQLIEPDDTREVAKPNASINITQLIESARHDASESEKHAIQEEIKFAQTPVGRLQHELKQPHTETRLANGMLKITTLSGITICWQAVPLFQSATPAADLYNVAMGCP